MQESIRFIKKLDPDYIDVLLAVPIPNSRLFKEALEEKKNSDDVWEKISKEDYPIPIYVPDGVTLKEMTKLQTKAYKTFYFNFHKILKEIIEISSIRDMFSRLRTAYNILFYY